MDLEIKVEHNGFVTHHFIVRDIVFHLNDDKSYISFVAIREDGCFSESGMNALRCGSLQSASMNCKSNWPITFGELIHMLKHYLVGECQSNDPGITV